MLDFLGRRGRIVIVLTLLLAGGGVVIFLHAILFPFLLEGFLSYVLAPVIHRMHQWKIRGYQMPRGMAVILIYLLILFILSSGGSYLIPRVTAEMGRLTEEFPKAVSTFNQQWIPEINRRRCRHVLRGQSLGVPTRSRCHRRRHIFRGRQLAYGLP